MTTTRPLSMLDGGQHPIGTILIESFGYQLVNSCGPYVVLVTPDGSDVDTFTELDGLEAMNQAQNGQPVTLSGHNSPETAYHVSDYPYSFRQRTMIRYWIEHKPKHGYRFMSQTWNPKAGRWNKPKASTYSDLMVMTWHPETGHIRPATLHYHARLEQIDEYESRHGHLLDEHQRKIIAWLRAARAAESKVTWTVRSGSEIDPNEPRQTLREQAEIMHGLTTIEYLDA